MEVTLGKTVVVSSIDLFMPERYSERQEIDSLELVLFGIREMISTNQSTVSTQSGSMRGLHSGI